MDRTSVELLHINVQVIQCLKVHFLNYTQCSVSDYMLSCLCNQITTYKSELDVELHYERLFMDYVGYLKYGIYLLNIILHV